MVERPTKQNTLILMEHLDGGGTKKSCLTGMLEICSFLCASGSKVESHSFGGVLGSEYAHVSCTRMSTLVFHSNLHTAKDRQAGIFLLGKPKLLGFLIKVGNF